MEIVFDNLSSVNNNFDGTSFDLRDSSFVSLNGINFMTFYDLVLNNKRPISGSINVLGTEIKRTNRLEEYSKVIKKIGFVSEDLFSRYEDYLVLDLFLKYIKDYKVRKIEDKNQHAADSLKFVGLSKGILKKVFNELSYTEKKKVMLACVIAVNPSIIILDEFDKGLIFRDKENFKKLFLKLKSKFNKQFIFNSIIYDKVSTSNLNTEFQNDANNNDINNDNTNNLPFESNNPETNYLNTEPNNKSNNNINQNYMFNQSVTTKNYPNKIKNTTPMLKPQMKEPQIKPQNANGAFNSKIPNKFAIQKNNIKKNNLNNENDFQDNFHDKIMNVLEKKKITKPKINKNINKGKMIRKEINKNEEFQKIIEKIGFLESSEMNYDFYTKLSLIKNYINMKGDKMSSEDLINIDNDIQSMINTMNNMNNNNNAIQNKNNNNNSMKNKFKILNSK